MKIEYIFFIFISIFLCLEKFYLRFKKLRFILYKYMTQSISIQLNQLMKKKEYIC